MAQAFDFREVVPDEQVKTARQDKIAGERPVFSARIARSLVSRLDKARTGQNIGRQAHDIAGDRFSRRGGDQVKTRTGPAGPFLDDVDKAAHAALRILLGKPGYIGVDGLRDLGVDQVLHVPADSAEDKPGADRGNRQIGERYLEHRGAKELTESHRVSCIRHRVSSGGAEGRSLYRSWRATAKYERQ